MKDLFSFLRRAQSYFGRFLAVKEALDTLPAGVCFFNESGFPVLCNRRMYQLVQEMTGYDLQHIDELRNALDAVPQSLHYESADERLFSARDGRVWGFSETVVTDESGADYTQVIARDITQLYALSEQAAQRNRELQEMLSQIQDAAKNVVEMTRQEEILDAKMRIHAKMGSCILYSKSYYVGGDAGDKDMLLSVWEDTLRVFDEEIGQKDDTDILEDFTRVANNCGVSVAIEGPFPTDRATANLIVSAQRECLTNLIAHARGDHMDVSISRSDGRVTAAIRNNGTPPSEPITEGGGLSSLRKKIERAGGRVTVQSRPVFILTVTLPEGEKGAESS